MWNADVLGSSIVSGFLLGGILALTALGLSIVLGVMRLVNLAHGEFLVAGAYAGLFFLKITGIDPLLGVPLIGATIGLLALPIYQFLLAPLSATGAEAPMITTFGLSIILQNIFILGFSADTRAIDRDYASAPLSLGPVTVPLVYLIGFLISVVAFVAVHLLVSHTRFGRDLRASAIDSTAAAIVGVDVRRVYLLTFALGAACAGIGGTLIGVAFSFMPNTGGAYLLTDFAIVVLGGLGNIFGTLIGGITLGVLQSFAGVLLGDGYRDLVGLLVFLIALAVRPHGLLGARNQ
jgi:branched-chain amino acid transport system permease protein